MSDQKQNNIAAAGREVEILSKTLFHRIVSWIKAHPLLTLLFSFLFSVASNLVSQWLWNIFE
ncbi:MAG: hypothetical protein J5895_02190 [Alphaproteobacteria bacterium]|nr:hypothetical protein [Alphaproteobacteria bacterium]